MGEMVPFEDDFFNRSDEIRDHYSVRVNSAVVMPAEEYVKTQGLTMEEVWPDGTLTTDILAVEVTIQNSNDKNADLEEDTQFFDMINIQIMSQGDSYQLDNELLWKMYPKLDQSTFGFRVAPGTEHTLTIPYAVLDWQRTDSEAIKHKKNYLLLSMYPTKKMIEVIPE